MKTSIWIAILCASLSIAVVSSFALERPPIEKAVEMTNMYQEGMPSFAPLDQMFKVEKFADYDDGGFYMNVVSIHEHLGTHMDAPAHKIRGGKFLPDVPLDSYWMVPATVFDVSEKCAQNADYKVTVDDITAWESAHGKIPDGAWLVINTGWYKKTSDLDAFWNKDEKETWHFPGVGAEAANFLVNERNIKGVALDVTSIDNGADISTGTSDVHDIILGAEILIVENVTNLDKLPATGALLSISPLLVDKASGGPVRVIGILP